METRFDPAQYSKEVLLTVAQEFFDLLRAAVSLKEARRNLIGLVIEYQTERVFQDKRFQGMETIVRDCGTALVTLFSEQGDTLSGFSVLQALFDLARGLPRSDLEDGFFAEMIALFRGLTGHLDFDLPEDPLVSKKLSGLEASLARSAELDKLWEQAERGMSVYDHGLMEPLIERRQANKKRILAALGGTEADWQDWKWQIRHVIRTAEKLASLVPLNENEIRAINVAKEHRVPFGITPYYASLFDPDLACRDLAVRAQVIPTLMYVEKMAKARDNREGLLDFMLERNTSPVPLITRRYPSICILKPYNTCPQICVYCQRNWEIDDVLSEKAFSSKEKVMTAIDWIKAHPAIKEVLITGGDPMIMPDHLLQWVIEEVAQIETIERIRLGTRTLVTMPMRFTAAIVDLLKSIKNPMKRDICVVTHVETPYEITPELFQAVKLLRENAIYVYNQLVYTFYVSRRFEATLLRRLLKRVGIDPYYTFNAKGKEETSDYRVPIARLLQEQKEEAMFLSGMGRTDTPVFNVPGLGKNYLLAVQHRDLVTIMPNGARVYQFHPWEKNIKKQRTYLSTDVPILDYLKRLAAISEDPNRYKTIWYYF